MQRLTLALAHKYPFLWIPFGLFFILYAPTGLLMDWLLRKTPVNQIYGVWRRLLLRVGQTTWLFDGDGSIPVQGLISDLSYAKQGKVGVRKRQIEAYPPQPEFRKEVVFVPILGLPSQWVWFRFPADIEEGWENLFTKK